MLKWDFKTLFEKDGPVEAKEPKKKKEWENYIWIDGYKGTDADMSCTVFYDKRVPGQLFTTTEQHSQQYELNKIITYGGEPEVCESGFHFCTSLADVFRFRPLAIGARYFKVKGFVKEKDVKEFSMSEDKVSKFAAKQIILTEEIVLDYDFLKENSLNRLKVLGKTICLSKEEFEDCFIQKKYSSNEDFVKKMFYKTMKKADYSDVFIQVIMDKKRCNELVELIPLVKVLDAEGVSKDMAVYTLLTWREYESFN